jgi:hypothetical protein
MNFYIINTGKDGLCNFFLLLIVTFTTPSVAQKSSFLVLGDLHYDLLEDHDMEWLRQKPDDLRQVTEEYTVYTKKKTDMLPFLGKELGESDAKYKFVAVYGPFIPVTERCWHILRRDSLRRESPGKPVEKMKTTFLIN